MRILFFLIAISLTNGVHGQSKFDVRNIPAELLEGADMVIRRNDVTFELISESKSKLDVKQAVTFLNENSKHFEQFVTFYNSFMKIGKLSATVYNSEGKVEKRILRGEFFDYSAINGFSLYEDTRMKGYNPSYSNYPFTLEFTSTINYDGFVIYPNWNPHLHEKASVENSKFKVKFPNDNPIRYQEKNLSNAKFRKSEDEGITELEWVLNHSLAIKSESNSPSKKDLFPQIRIAANRFEMGGHVGDMSSWEGFGLWYDKLNNGLDKLPVGEAEQIAALVDDTDSTIEKVKKVYQHMQNSTRYVSVQIGIGGWKSFSASTTSKYGYGDCKALTTYTKAMLNSLNIESYYALVKAGKSADPIDRSFPSFSFNHVFLCVPLEQDTVWLECTSQEVPFGYLGHFTSDRDVLVVDKGESKIIRTPKYSGKKNSSHTNAVVKINKDGEAEVKIKLSLTGLNYEKNGLDRILKEDLEMQRTWLKENLSLNGLEIISHEFIEKRERVPEVHGIVDLKINNIASGSGNYRLLRLNLFDYAVDLPAFTSNRTSNYIVKSSFQEVDTIHYNLPPGFEVSDVPDEINIISNFGEYKTAVSRPNKSQLKYIRTFDLYSGSYSPERYMEYYKFRKKIADLDKRKILLKEKT